MKPILPALLLCITPIALVSCGDKGGAAKEGSPSSDSSSSSASIKTHDAVGKEMVAIMSELMTGVTTVKDVATAEAFAAKVPTLKTRMKDLLKAAQSLPAPTEEEKTAINKMMDDAEEKAGPAVMQTMMSMGQNPDAEAIGKVMEGAMQDEEMDKVGSALEEIYKIKDAAEPEAGAEPAAEDQ